MSKSEPKAVPLAVRVFPAIPQDHETTRHSSRWRRPSSMLVFDTETRTDATQRLTFGSYRFVEHGDCLEEGLLYADDLPAQDCRILEGYVAKHRSDALDKRSLRLLTLSQFLNVFFDAGYRARCLIVGFNLPFDLSRIARDFTSARGRFVGGFSLGLWTYQDENGLEHRNSHRPRVCIKHIDSKRALKGFTARKDPDRSDLIPEGSRDGKPEPGYKFRGHFLDARTLAFALTDRGYSLENACKAFEVQHGKQHVSGHGGVSPEYISYNRRDVQATVELTLKLLEEYDKHPITLQPTKAYSPASIGKAYLREMGIQPILERQPDFPRRYLGYAASAFYGGRTSAHIRKVCVPIVYTDFLSMYPTVNSLMDLWRFVIAGKINVVDHCQAEIERYLRRLKPDDLFNPATWKQLSAFVKIIPDGDILPSRGRYSVETNDWQVGVNHLYTATNNPKHSEMWFSLPDVVASVLLTGKTPKIVDAFRVEAQGKQLGLQPTKLRGDVAVDPGEQDFFRTVIEQRKLLSARKDLSDRERERLDKALKVLANAASYGIYAEMNRVDTEDEITVTCHGIDKESFRCRVAHPDNPGEYCFPPLASLITGAARLMLALLEHRITQLGGTYAMEDTDSMAIVATEEGGTISLDSCRKNSGVKLGTVTALSWNQVREISAQFRSLNPYNREAISGSILKIEDDNYENGVQRELYCYAISAKRYALVEKDRHGAPALLRKGENNETDRWSKHGMGHLLNPTDPESDDREWIGQVWLNMVRESLGLSTQKLDFDDLPAIGRVTVSSPAIMKPLMELNQDKTYPDQMKPFNFVLTCHVKPFGHPLGTDPTRFHLIGAYESDPRKWLGARWIDQYSGTKYAITTRGHHGDRETARVKTYGDVMRDHQYHSESKCADSDGEVCCKQTIGLLQRRHVRVEQIRYVGKESNGLEAIESGEVHSESEVYTEYVDFRRDEWATLIQPALKKIPLAELIGKTGLSRRTLIEARAGRSRPHPRNRLLLKKLLSTLTRSLRPGCFETASGV